MAKTIQRIESRTAKNPIAEALQQTLKDSYAAYLLTHNYHWNVEGPNFAGLHTLFEQQYNDLFMAIDTIAERIRAIGAYALKGGYDHIAGNINGLTQLTGKDRQAVAQRMIENLIAANEKVIASAQATKRKAESAKDDETVDLMVERIQTHQKAVWMLQSSLI